MKLTGKLIKSGHTYKLRVYSKDGDYKDLTLLTDNMEVSVSIPNCVIVENNKEFFLTEKESE